MFTSIGEAAKELGFSKCGVGKAFHEKRNRIGEYELEWLEPELDVHPGAAKKIERLKKTFNRIGEYELEWLEPELDVHPKLDVHPRAAKKLKD